VGENKSDHIEQEKMNQPKISIVTCCYNHAQFVEETIQSVLTQGYPNVEYIVIDGGSTDGSAEIIARYASQLSYWVSERDNGQTDALIKGFARATGEISCWLCSDDILEPWTLHEVAEFFTQHPAARVVYGDATWIDVNGRFLRKKKEHGFNRYIWMYDHNFIPQPSTFWRHELYREVGGLDPKTDIAMDADLWLRFSDVTKLHHVNRPWSRMRSHPLQRGQVSKDREKIVERLMRERYLGHKSEWNYRWNYLCAKGLRVGWKALTGRY
jgi:glycosyltransferase involved in cell wall biosynthesis